MELFIKYMAEQGEDVMRKGNYKVSIVLPVYNGETYLSLAVESILRQTYGNWELIIVDDCSTDKSYGIAKSYAQKDPRVRVYKNHENRKLPRSLNAGFHMATGDLFTWTSDDNILGPEMIERLVRVFEERPEVDFVYADIIPIDKNGGIKKEFRYLNGEVDDIYVFNPILACFMYKREVQEALKGYDPQKILYEDYDFWLRTYEKGFHMYHLKKRLYYYRFHDNALSSQRRKECYVIQLHLLRKNFFREKKWNNKRKILIRIKKMKRELKTLGKK